MKIFLTGHLGYIGTHLLSLLLKEGHYIIGCDLNLYGESAHGLLAKPNRELCMDVRSLTPAHLKGCNCVMHLAAISNDPMGELDPTLTEKVNTGGSLHLARIAKQAGVSRFLFASSCSIYGQHSDTRDLDEQAPLQPQSVYARSKIEAEKGISALASADFSPVFLRNATAYGDSPVLRLDLVVNNLLAHAFTRNEIRIQSDGSPWRPLIHAKDIARAFIALLHAPRPLVHNLAINIGANRDNVQVREIAQKILNYCPGARIAFTGEAVADPRNYRVSFDLLSRLLPDFRLEYTLNLGIEELKSSFLARPLTREEFEGGRFTRLALLKKRFLENHNLF